MFSEINDRLNYTCYGGQAEKLIGRELSDDWRIFPCAVLVCVEAGDSYLLWPDGRKTVAKSGQALFVAPEIPHKYGVMDDSKISFIHFSITVSDYFDAFKWFDIPNLIDEENTKEIHSLCIDLLRSSNPSTDTAGLMLAKACEYSSAFKMFERLLRCGMPSSDINIRMESYLKIKPVLQYIDQNANKQMTRAELAQIMFLSPNRFHYVFKDIMGIPPMSYVKQIRMNRAKLMLCDPKITVGEIALSLGFQDLSSFSHAFKSAVGITPMLYRERIFHP